MTQQLTLVKRITNVLLILATAVPLCKATSADMGAPLSDTGSLTFSTSQPNSNVVANTTSVSTQFDTLSVGATDYANVFETTVTKSSTGITVTLSSTADLNNVSLPVGETSSADFVVLANGNVTLNGNPGLEIGAPNNSLQASYVPVLYSTVAPVAAATPPIIAVPAAVPEPGTYFITGLGLALLGAAAAVRRRRVGPV